MTSRLIEDCLNIEQTEMYLLSNPIFIIPEEYSIGMTIDVKPGQVIQLPPLSKGPMWPYIQL